MLTHEMIKISNDFIASEQLTMHFMYNLIKVLFSITKQFTLVTIEHEN